MYRRCTSNRNSNNNVEFVSASATDIATFTNNYKIQDKRPSIEKELTIQKRVLELSVGNTVVVSRDLDYTRALIHWFP
ncbi:MAG: hypothetical protein ACLVAT_05250 [Lachnospiraceae bacterium]